MSNRQQRESVVLESPIATKRKLRAIFDWRDDRYGHCVEVFEDGSRFVLLNSKEVAGSDHWPLSPPLQQIHAEERGSGQRVVLLVGMSDKHHWSASVEADASGEAITFDVACRIGAGEIVLRSTYQIVADIAPDWKLEPIACGGQIASVNREGDILTITPAPISARTMRWKYRMIITATGRHAFPATGLAPVV